MTTAMIQPRSGSDLQHSGLAGYRIVPVAVRRGLMELDAGAAQVLASGSQQVAFADAWNDRMDALGARRGSWDELRQLLPA